MPPCPVNPPGFDPDADPDADQQDCLLFAGHAGWHDFDLVSWWDC